MRKQMAKISNEYEEKTPSILYYDFIEERDITFSNIEKLESLMNSAPKEMNDAFKNEVMIIFKEVIQSLQNQNDIQKRQIDNLFKKDKDRDKG